MKKNTSRLRPTLPWLFWLAVSGFGFVYHFLHVDPVSPPVPCLGVVVGSDPNLFLLRLFHSLDHPVQRLVIAHGGTEQSVQMQINHLKNANVSTQNLVEVNLHRWPGVSEGWNSVLKACSTDPWVMLLNVDIQVTLVAP